MDNFEEGDTKPKGEYEVGDNGLVIPTDMAIASLMQLLDVGSLYINLDTVVRNTIDSFPTAAKETLRADKVIDIIKHDVDSIAELLPQTTVTYYYPRYQNLPKVFTYMKQRVATTEKQLARKKLFDNTHLNMRQWLNDEKINVHFTSANVLGMPRIESNYILTHHPVDLLKASKSIKLIESNTGAVLSSLEFNRKLYKGKEYPNLPFNTLTLNVMGDNADFSPLSSDVKGLLVTLAAEFKWTPITPKTIMKRDLVGYKDHLASEVFTLILNSFD